MKWSVVRLKSAATPFAGVCIRERGGQRVGFEGVETTGDAS